MPAPPFRDQHGTILPHDHPEILDADYVLRHIVPPHDLHPDPAKGTVRVSSGAYSESSDGGMSVDIIRWMAADGLDACDYLAEDGMGATKIRVGDLRALGLMVGWDPDTGHEHHGAVWGIKDQKQRRRISKLAITVRKAAGET
ncbi:hypothetical protein [Bradyrhizobium lupini]|uniref:hypothetical protein n=1 Tax=Rhizobium lupini TaxID=136996 RepID=UPI0034C67495